MKTRAMLSRCLLGVGIALLFISFPLMAGNGPLIAISGLVLLVASVGLAPRQKRSGE